MITKNQSWEDPVKGILNRETSSARSLEWHTLDKFKAQREHQWGWSMQLKKPIASDWGLTAVRRNWNFIWNAKDTPSAALSQISVPHYHEAELSLATNGSTSGKITKKQVWRPCYRISFIWNARLFSKPNDSIKQIRLDGSTHLIYRRGAICFPRAHAGLSVQPGCYAVVWEAKAQQLRHDGWLTSEEYTFINESASATPSLPASSLEQRPTRQAP